jgi:hypothetical protein
MIGWSDELYREVMTVLGRAELAQPKLLALHLVPSKFLDRHSYSDGG